MSEFENSKFKTVDKIIGYISLMGNNMCQYANMVGENYTYFISNHHKFIENDKIEEVTLLKGTNNNLDPFLYHLGKCSVDSFKRLERSQIHSCWPHDVEEGENVDVVEEDEDHVLVEEDIDLIE